LDRVFVARLFFFNADFDKIAASRFVFFDGEVRGEGAQTPPPFPVPPSPASIGFTAIHSF
jgi:hypothetical protein